MEAARKSQPNGAPPSAVPPAPDAAAAPKLTIEKFADGAISCLKFNGNIDESFEGKKIARSIQADTLVLDLGGVKKISSFGIREWVDFATTAVKQVKQMVLIECAPKVVDQLNMVANFNGGGRVFSFYAPFRCDYCDSEQRVLLEVNKDFDAIKAMKLGDRPCPSCKESMYFDEDGSTYFSYMLTQGPFELDPDIITFLSSKLDYRVGTVDQKIRIDKLIEGRLTYLRLAGDLNNTFPREKLAEGLEGTVIVDVSNVPRVEPAGAAEWRGFIQMVTPVVESLYLVGVQPAFLEKLCDAEGLGPKGVVVDTSLPYQCNSCGAGGHQTISVAEHHDVLKFATAPDVHCQNCKAAMACTASEQAMTILPGLPKPVLAKDLEKQIGILKSRKFEKRLPAAAAAAKPVAPRSSLVPILFGLILVAATAGGVLFYMKQTKEQDPGPYGHGPLVARSVETAPVWIKPGTAPGLAYCGEDGGELSCVGVSTISPSQEDAEDEASDAAVEAIAFEIGKRITDKQWVATIPPIYTTARDAKLAALNRDPQSTQARRDVRDGRRAVAHALRGVNPTAAGRYWEAYEGGRDGRRYLAYVQVKLPVGAAQKLMEEYTTRKSAFGATVVTFFPELAWRFPKVTRGAVVIGLETGALQTLGVAEHSVILAIDGRDVPDAASFAKIITEERAMLEDRGGSLRILVQSDAGDPREFSQSFAGRPIEIIEKSGKRGKDRGNDASGGINIWDRTGGGRGTGRDDPTQ